jgi:hypothetical protein
VSRHQYIQYEPLLERALRLRPGGMEVPVNVNESVLSTLGELRRGLQGELEELLRRRSMLTSEQEAFVQESGPDESDTEILLERQSVLDRELQALDAKIEFKQRALELVAATESLVGGQDEPQPDLGGVGPAASMQVRVSVNSMHLRLPWTPPEACVCARCRAAASAAPHEGPPHGALGGPPLGAADVQGRGAAGVHLPGA